MSEQRQTGAVLRSGVLLLAGVALGWGCNWPVMKLVLADIPPLTFRALSLVLGGLTVLALAHHRALPLAIPRALMIRVLWLTLFNALGWNLLATYGLQLLPPGRAALLGYTMPLWCLPLSALILGESMHWSRLSALALGLGGIAVLLADGLEGLTSSILGCALMIAAAWCWAIGIVLLRRWKLPMNTLVLTGWMLLLGGLPLVPAAIMIDGPTLKPPGTAALAGLLYNIFIAFTFCYWAWNRLVISVPVSVSSLSSLLTPVIGIAASSIVFARWPSGSELGAASLMLAAIALALYGTQRWGSGRVATSVRGR